MFCGAWDMKPIVLHLLVDALSRAPGTTLKLNRRDPRGDRRCQRLATPVAVLVPPVQWLTAGEDPLAVVDEVVGLDQW